MGYRVSRGSAPQNRWGFRDRTYKEMGKNCEIPPKTMMTATTRLTIRLHPKQE